MKSKLLALLLTLMMCCSMLLLASCGGTTDGSGNVDAGDTTYSSVYGFYVDYAEANGITPESYEVWLETITGADGVLGVTGNALKIRINGKSNDWEISYDGGILWTSLGFKAATANIVGVVDIKFSSVEEEGKLYLVVDYYMSNNTSSSTKIEIGTVGGETPDQPGEGGGETPDQPGEGGGETPDQPGEGGGENPDQPGEGGGETPDQPGEGGGDTPDQPGEGGGEDPDQGLNAAKEKALSEINEKWAELNKYVDLTSYESAYSGIFSDIENAKSVDEIDGFAKEFATLYETVIGEVRAAILSDMEKYWAELAAMGDVTSYEGTYEGYVGIVSGTGDIVGLVDIAKAITDFFDEVYEALDGNEGGEIEPPVEGNLDEIKNATLSDMAASWAALEDWADVEDYEEAYKNIIAKVENATSEEEIHSYVGEFHALYETIFGELKAELAVELDEIWAEFGTMGDLSGYETAFAAYRDALGAVTNIDDLVALVDEVNDFLDEVYESIKGSSGEDGKPTIIKVELINGTVTYEIGSNISFSELLMMHGTAINIMYSDGTGKATFITPDMFYSGFEQNIDVPGTYEFGIIYTDEFGEMHKLILIVNSVDNGQGGENPDLPTDGSVINTNAIEYFTALGIYGLKLYDNSTYSFIFADGSVYDEAFEFYYYDESTIVVYFQGMIPVVLTVYEDNSATMYSPMGDVMVLGTYFMEVPMPDGSVARSTYSVLDYYINGMNVIIAYGPVGTQETLTFTDLTLLGSLDLEAGTLSYAGMTLYINEDGSLSTSRPGAGDNTLDSYKKEVLYTIADEWDYLSEYVELDKYEEEYKYIYESILNASTIEEAKDYETQFYGLYDHILSDITIMLHEQMNAAWVGYNQRGDVSVFTEEYNHYFNRVSNASSIEELVELVDLISELFEKIEDYLNGAGGNDVYDTIKKLVEEAWNYFYDFNNAFGYVWEETYYPLAQQHISHIECATSIDEAEAYFQKFIATCDGWANNFNTEVKVQYIEISSYSAEFTQGVSADEVIEWILNNVYATVYFTDGSSTVIRLTEDMIMGELPEVLDDIDAYYELNINIEYDYYNTNRYFSIRLNPDLSDVTVIGSFKRGEGDMDHLFEFAGITLYDNKIALVENYEGDSEYFEYFTYGDELISIRIDGVEVYYSINRESGIFSDFVYSENVIGEYNVYDEGITIIFTGDYNGSGYYFVKYGAYVSESCFDFVTIEMYLNLESGIIVFLDQEMGILEDGKTVDTLVNDERKENYASYVMNEWENYSSNYNLSELKDRYETLLAKLYSLKYNHELDKWREERDEFLSDLYDFVNGSGEGGDPIEVYLVKAYLTGWSVSVPQYASYSSTAELLNANGISICYEFSDGSCYYGPVTDDMVTRHIDTSVAGNYVFAIEIATEAGMFMGSVSVEVYPVETPDEPDVPEGNLIGEFNTAEDDYLYFAFNAYSISLYDNYTVRFNGETPYEGQYLDFEYHSDNVIAVLVDGQYMMLSLDYGAMTVYGYTPDESVEVIGTYTMTVFGYDFWFIVYDEYFFGQNITVNYGPVGEEMASKVTSVSYLNLENNTLTVNGVVYYILEGNILSESQSGEKTVVKIELSTTEIYVGRGESLGNALFNAINTTLYVNVYYSDGSMSSVSPDMSMFSEFDPNYVPASGEQVRAYFMYEADNYGWGTSVYFYGIEDGGEIEPDLGTTVYTFSENTHIFYSLVLSNHSNSGTLNTYEGGIEIYYYDCGDYFEVDAGVTTFLFGCDKEGLTVFNYAPDYSTASSYYLKNDGTYMLFDVLGEYYGADWYVCNYYASVGEIEASCTIKVWLDLESSILRTADFDEVTFIINPDGSLSTYGSGSGEGNIEEIQYLAEKAWDYFYGYVDKFGYDFENKYGYAFKEYYSRIKSASSYEEAKMHYSEFCMVCEMWAKEFSGSAVPSINYIELNSGNAEFLLGVTASEVIDWIVSNVTATVYFSDGSEEVIAITYDMIRNYLPEVLDELDRYYEVGVELSYNGYNYSYDYIRIVISPDLSGASVLGSYKRAENDMDYCFEFAAITIYDNGIILVEDYDGDSMYAEFGWYLDNVITINVESVDVYYSFDNETGIFTDYVPEGEVIGKYNIYDENITLIFVGEYTGAGEYFVLYGLEEGDISDFVTIKMYLDIESSRIYFFGQELIILEDNSVVTAMDEESRENARRYLVEEWEYNSQYYDLSELADRYNELLAMIDSLKYQHELHEWYNMRDEFIQDMHNLMNGGEDLRIQIEEAVNRYQEIWWKLESNFGELVYNYQDEFYYYMNGIKCAGSYDELEKYSMALDDLFYRIEEECSSNQVYISHIEINRYDYQVVEGTSFDEFYEEFLNSAYITVYYTDSTSEIIYITDDMISFPNGIVEVFTAGYSYYFTVEYNENNHYRSFNIYVEATADMSNAEFLGSFITPDGNPDALTTAVQFDIYDNGFFVAHSAYGDTATVPYLEYSDSVIMVQAMSSLYVLYKLDVETMTFYSYVPEAPVYNKYIVGVDDDMEVCPTMTIYCERNEKGEFVAVVEGWADSSMEMWVSITMLVSVDEESGLIWYAGQPMIAVDGVLMPYVSEEEIANRIENMQSEWENLSMYYDVSAYAERYKAIIEAMYSVNNYYEYSDLCDQFYEMVNQIHMNGDMGGDIGGDIGGDVTGGNESDKWEDPSSPVDGAAELFYFDIANPIPYLGNRISIYDNGYVAIYGEHGTVYCDYEVEGENILLLDFNGTIIIYELDFESFIARTYKEEVFYGPYTDYYDNGDFERIYVYGEYAGAGDYAGLYEMCEDGMMYEMSVAFYFDLDKMYIDLGPTILYFDGNGDIYEVVHKDSGSDSEAPDSGSGSGEVELPSVDMGNDYGEVVSPDYSYSVNDGNYNVIIGETTTNPSYSYDASYGELVTDGEYSFTVNGDGTAEYIYSVNGEDDELKYSYVTVK